MMTPTTEAQAKCKWCPFARNAPDGDAVGTFNRYYDGGDLHAESVAPCIASRCMAWCWYDRAYDYVNCRDHGPTRRGFCGLAGKAVMP